MGVFCIEVTTNDESTSYSFKKPSIHLSFDVVPRTLQTNHGDVFFGFNIQRRRLNVLSFKFDFFIMIDIIFNYYRSTTSGFISGMWGVFSIKIPGLLYAMPTFVSERV
jgi:hypothetical protein